MTDLPGLLAAAGIPGDLVASAEPIAGGTFNEVHRVRLRDGSGVVVKVAPAATPLLTYEHGILATEALFDRLAGAHGVPVPEVLHSAPGVLVMRECPGAPWFEHGDGPDWQAMRRELGGHVARLHEIAGPGFGYPAGPLHATWPEAFLGMVGAVLADSERWAVELPALVGEIRAAYARHADLLAVVETPRLVHYDLWDGNILVADGRCTALIDAERAFWGDPLADFVSLALAGDIERDTAFLDGYGPVTFNDSARRRLALYRGYLALIMLVEQVPRQATEEHRRWVDDAIRPDLEKVLNLESP